MIVSLLHSSSSGNCTVIETSTTKIIVDAGISYKKICDYYGKDLVPNALFITHEHSDHVKGAGVLGRKTMCTIYIAEPSYKAIIETKEDFFKNCIVEHLSGGDEITVGDLLIKSFSTKHDSMASLGYIITELSTGKKFGFLTDTGYFTPLIKSHLQGCDGYFLECDYDVETLQKYAEYTDDLKERIASPIGHLSNQQTLSYIKENIDLEKISKIILGHLSERTNSPELLRSQIKETFEEKYWDKILIGDIPVIIEV